MIARNYVILNLPNRLFDLYHHSSV